MGNKLKITRPSRRKQRIRAIQNTIGGILALGAIMLTVHCYQLSNGVDVVDRIRYGSENYTVRFRVADTDYKCPKGFTAWRILLR